MLARVVNHLQAKIVIRPDLGHIGLLEFDRAAEAIETGERAAAEAIAELQAIVAGS